MEPLLLIDHSYYVFYKYYSIAKWYKFVVKTDPDHKNIFDDKIFMEKYDSMYFKTLKELIKKHKTSESNVLLAMDCERCNIWRNDIAVKDYKGERDIPKGFNGKIFEHTRTELIPLLSHARAFSVPRAEADDIIGVITKLERSTNPTRPIIIIASDRDYLQLCDEHTHVLSMNNKNLLESSHFKNGFKEMMLKIIVGDKSDNIPPIAKGLGPKRSAVLVEDQKKLKELLNDPIIKKQFDNNRVMIDMSFIPDDIQEQIVAKYGDA